MTKMVLEIQTNLNKVASYHSSTRLMIQTVMTPRTFHFPMQVKSAILLTTTVTAQPMRVLSPMDYIWISIIVGLVETTAVV